MIAVENTLLVLLAAGRSARFGDIGSKLDQEFLGRPLGLHVAVALEDMPFKERLAIVGHQQLDYGKHGFRIAPNPDRDLGMATSVQIGVRRAQELGAEAILVCLADMPRLTATHLHRLFDASEGDMTVVASSDGVSPKPPALFGRGQFAGLLDLAGDTGARELVAGGRHVVTTPSELIDVDTPEELERLRALVHAPEGITRVEPRRRD